MEAGSQELEELIAYHNSRRSYWVNRLIQEYQYDTMLVNSIDSVIAVLEAEESTNYKCQLIEAYITKRDFQSAQRLIDELNAVHELQRFCQLQQLHLYAAKTGISLVISVQKNDVIKRQVEEIAADSTRQGSVQARALLMFALDYEYPIRLEMPVGKGSAKTGDPDAAGNKEITEEQPIINNKPLTINVYPNPSSGQITIEAYLPAGTTAANITIYNMLGEKVKDFTLTTGVNSNVINAGELSEGLYLYLLESNGITLHKDKLVIVK